MAKPLILLTPSCTTSPLKRLYVNRAYVAAVESAGGIALTLSRPKDLADIAEVLATVDGVLLTGGVDVHPDHYNEKPEAHCGEIDPERDRVELALFEFARTKKMPILGICRGMQLMNVALGGTLHQDVAIETKSAVIHERDHETERRVLAHPVSVVPDTMLSRIVEVSELSVNSLHHQGIDKIGGGLIPSAHAPDGLVEAIEYPGHPFMLGIEWHPEELPDDASKGIFSAFLDATKKKRDR